MCIKIWVANRSKDNTQTFIASTKRWLRPLNRGDSLLSFIYSITTVHYFVLQYSIVWRMWFSKGFASLLFKSQQSGLTIYMCFYTGHKQRTQWTPFRITLLKRFFLFTVTTVLCLAPGIKLRGTFFGKLKSAIVIKIQNCNWSCRYSVYTLINY